MNKDIRYIQHIKEYCEEINTTVQRFGDEFAVFESDSDYYKSVSMSIMQIGELCNNLSENFKNTQSGIPWATIRAVRNMFAHEYKNVDKEVIWDTVKNDIPNLERFCESVISEYGEGNVTDG